MRGSIREIAREAFQVDHEEFSKLVLQSTDALAKEEGRLGNLTVSGGLVEIEPVGKAIVISDIHGDAESLLRILKDTDFLNTATEDDRAYLILLGDYGDRGILSVEVYYIILKLKSLLPEQVILLRGNHEGPMDLLPSPHGLPQQLRSRFGDRRGADTYSNIRDLFRQLHICAIIKDRYLILHGGLPRSIGAVEDLALAQASHPRTRHLEDILWSDPTEQMNRVRESPRGAGRLFGEETTDSTLQRLKVKILIRGHEPCESGYRINHSGKVLTLFSRRGPPYFNSHGAYLRTELSPVFESAEQLIPSIATF